MDSKTAAALDRAARQTLETVELRKAQDRINRQRREEAEMSISPAAKQALLDRIAALSTEIDAAESEFERVQGEARELYAALRRMADGMHTGDYADTKAALDQATTLLSRLGPQYER